MRTPLTTLTLALSLAACSSGGGGSHVVVQSAPEPPPTPPLEVTIARPVNGKLYVQTNRPAYVAIFEIVPERGVTLAHPTTPRQSRVTLSGMHRLPVWWNTQGGAYRSVGSKVTAKPQPTRYLYAVASDEPLALTDASFQPGYMRRVLGAAYRADDPYLTMRAISSEFVPSVPDEEWAEDLHVLTDTPAAQPERLARVYCPDGSVYRVPEEIADDVWCPMRREGTTGIGQPGGGLMGDRGPSRPDSVFGDNGRRVAARMRPTRRRAPADRIVFPADDDGKKTRPADEKETKESKGSKVGSRPETPEPRGRGLDRREGGALRPIPAPRSDNGKGALQHDDKATRSAPGQSPDRVKPTAHPESVDRAEIPVKSEGKAASTPAGKGGKPEAKGKPETKGKNEGKPEGKPERDAKPEQDAKPEGKSESKSSAKPESKRDDRDEAKGESKDESKGEAKGQDKKGSRADDEPEAESDDEKKKPDEKAEKSDEKPAQGKPKKGRPD